MEKRTLGQSEIGIAPLAFGGNVLGWTADSATSLRLLDAFLDAGCNLVDTADVYSKWVPGHQGGESETVIGEWLKKSGRRKEVVLASKVGAEMAPDRKGLSRDHILRSVDESLRRLQTDYIDLYQTHYDDLDTPIEETLSTYAELIQSGKVRAIGTSNMSPERLLQSLAVSEEKGLPRYETLEPEYNLYDREGFERQYAPVCQQYNLGVISYYSLASGFLSGKYRSEADVSKSPRGKKAMSYLNKRGFAILEALDNVAERYHSTPAAVSLAWLMVTPGITAPIASATSLEQLGELIQATQLQLDSDAMELLNLASSY
ncbi:aldo/keto reductase [Chitinophaga pendula]|uniref:aldo/keto reductase n=1 Tax=Chitinophaga TaxID=79328 RepID=UPI000BAEE6B5|nr:MULTISPECIES: aldo/keto reductase [Chitinophaga]ASZ15021.1 alcohol dehydrogenase [Chitinophaga sp. MD30]UCJ09408.1 aldo/keto reductase [Chitinophaga pendula]